MASTTVRARLGVLTNTSGGQKALWRSIVALVIALGAWSFSPLLIVKSSHLAKSPIIALYAVSVGALLALASTSISPELRVTNLIRIARRDNTLWKSAAVGAVAFIAYPVLYFSAIQSGPPALANLVNYLWPIVGMIVVARYRRETRSLEIFLAGGFGLAGAALAIVDSSPSLSTLGRGETLLPFALAAAGACAYGGVSGYMNISQPSPTSSRLHFLTLALLIAGAIAIATLALMAIFDLPAVKPNFMHGDVLPLVIYATLLPCAHLSWLTAVQDRRIPGLTTAFLVPVIATAVLAVALKEGGNGKLFSALTLVICAIAFSASRERGIPVVFAVTLSALGSVEVSQSLANVSGHNADAAGSFFSQLLVGLVAIFDGFVLSNAIGRYTRLREACGKFYQRAFDLATPSPALVADELERLESLLLANSILGHAHKAEHVVTVNNTASVLAPEWSDVDIALADGVSRYEWLVLVLGSTGVIISLYAFAFGSTSIVTLTLRAFSTAVIVGVLFAIQDYDRNRPEQLVEALLLLRRRYNFPEVPGSTITLELQNRGVRRRSSVWSAIGLGALTIAVISSIAINVR